MSSRSIASRIAASMILGLAGAAVPATAQTASHGSALSSPPCVGVLAGGSADLPGDSAARARDADPAYRGLRVVIGAR